MFNSFFYLYSVNIENTIMNKSNIGSIMRLMLFASPSPTIPVISNPTSSRNVEKYNITNVEGSRLLPCIPLNNR